MSINIKSAAFLELPKATQKKYLTLEAISNGELSNYEVITFAKKHIECERTQNICDSFLAKTKNRIEANNKNIKKYQIDIDTPKLEAGVRYVVYSEKVKYNFVVYFKDFFYPFIK